MEPRISISIRGGKLESVCLLTLLFITESFAISNRFPAVGAMKQNETARV